MKVDVALPADVGDCGELPDQGRAHFLGEKVVDHHVRKWARADVARPQETASLAPMIALASLFGSRQQRRAMRRVST
jgi:hypothetical protein